jgi:hypothetical protein
MIRTAGCYVAGFRMAGTLTYLADDHGRNETKELMESLLRTVPEQSMRLQFRYEVVEGLMVCLRSTTIIAERRTPRPWCSRGIA